MLRAFRAVALGGENNGLQNCRWSILCAGSLAGPARIGLTVPKGSQASLEGQVAACLEERIIKSFWGTLSAGHMGVCDGSSYQDERRTDQPYGRQGGSSNR